MENSIDHIITRILSGNSSSEDFLSLSEWLNADEKNKKEFRLLKSYWDAEVSFSHSLMPNVSLDNLRKKIDDQSRQKRLRLIRFIATPIAAAIAFLVLFFATIHLNTREAKVQQFYTYITDKNKSHFTLDDGTKIILNRNSRFTYSDAYGTDQRKVNLEGEAYFEVAHNKEIPFYVQTENIKVQVTGTKFDVCSYKGSNSFIARLIEGSINLLTNNAKEEKPITSLTKGKYFSMENGKYKTGEMSSNNALAWMQGIYYFDDVPFKELLDKIALYYNYKITVKNPKILENYRCTGKFKDLDGIEHILKVIQKDHPFKYNIDNEHNKITIE